MSPSDDPVQVRVGNKLRETLKFNSTYAKQDAEIVIRIWPVTAQGNRL